MSRTCSCSSSNYPLRTRCPWRTWSVPILAYMYVAESTFLRSVSDTLPQGSRVFNGPDGVQYRWRPSSNNTDIVVSSHSNFFCLPALTPIQHLLIADMQISCKTLTVLSSPSSDQPARRGTKSATSSESCTSSVLLAPGPWCVVFHFPLLTPHQLFSVADAPSNHGHGDRDRDVVSFLLGVESLSLRTRTCDINSIF